MSVLAPGIFLSRSTLYANQKDIYALNTGTGAVEQSYSVQGLACATVVDETIYLNESCPPDYIVRALHASDGSTLWSYRVEGAFSDAPVITAGRPLNAH